jgi:hypothetical protein
MYCKKCPTLPWSQCPSCNQAYLQEAGDRSRIPAQGLWLVCNRLQGGCQRARNCRRPRPRPSLLHRLTPSRFAQSGIGCITATPPPVSAKKLKPRPTPAPDREYLSTMPFKKYLITGLLVWLPLAITVWVMLWLVNCWTASWRRAVGPGGFLPQMAEPDHRSSARHPRPGGADPGVLALLVTGALVSNVAGRWWCAVGPLFANIPIFKSIYNSVKKLSTTRCSPATATRFARPC